jgi:DNA-binding beta-propeller fold protein YncE
MRNQFCKFLTMGVLTAVVSAAASAQSIKTQIAIPGATLGIAANPVTNRIYVAAPTGGTTDNLAVIDGNADVLLENIAVPSGAEFVAVDYFANRIYVAGCNFNADPTPCTVTAVNGATNSVLSTIQVTTTPGLGLTGVVADPLDGRVYVANASDNVINIIDGFKAKLLPSTISLDGNSPAAIAINPFLGRLYVPYGTNQTAVICLLKKEILSTTDFGSSTVGAAVNFVTGKVYVTDQELGPSATGVLNANGTLQTSVPVGDAPLGVDVDPVTNLVFVVSTALDNVEVINGSTNTVTATVGGVPAFYVAVNFVSEKVYASGINGVTVLTEK